jgi:Asp-tRNA(Asn)/Glu-tRNA(Gln) amidotransferase A subunit family amidase
VALGVIRDLVAEVREVSLIVNPDRTLQAAESFAYHAEFVARSPELYQPETLRRIRSGERVSDADCARLRNELEQARRSIASLFDDFDLLITPTVPVPPPSLPELQERPDTLREKELTLLRNTRPFNVWGLPTISVPCGFTKSGLPIGLQIAGAPWHEDHVIALAHAYEQATEWHTRVPSTLQK